MLATLKLEDYLGITSIMRIKLARFCRAKFGYAPFPTDLQIRLATAKYESDISWEQFSSLERDSLHPDARPKWMTINYFTEAIEEILIKYFSSARTAYLGIRLGKTLVELGDVHVFF